MSLINENVLSLLQGETYSNNAMKGYAAINGQSYNDAAESLSNGFVPENVANPDDEAVAQFIAQSAKDHVKDACGIA